LADWKKDVKIAAIVATLMVPVFIAVAYFGADKHEIPLLISTQPARTSDIWYSFATVAMGAFFGSMIGRATRIAHYLLGAGGLLLVCYFWRYGFHGDASTGNTTGNVMAVVGGALTVLGLIALPFRATWRPRILKAAALAVIMGVFLLESVLAFRRFSTGDFVADIFQPPVGAETPVLQWIQFNTPTNSRFLISPFAMEFRALSKRTPFFIMREGSALMWDQAYATDWVRRMKTFGVKADDEEAAHYSDFLKQIDTGYAMINDDSAVNLANQEHLDYWVVSSRRFSYLPVVYQDEHFKVLKLRGAAFNFGGFGG
jgi:hypothetical protein